MPLYEVTISDLPDDEDVLKVHPQEMSEFMGGQGFRPKVAGDFTVWIGHSTLMPEILQGAFQNTWIKELGYAVTVAVVKLDSLTGRVCMECEE